MSKRFSQLPGVYKMFNLITGNTYIGSSKNVYMRIKRHQYVIRNKINDNIRIQKDAELHGADSFDFEVLEYCDNSNRFEREQHYFELLKPTYNVWPTIYSPSNRSYTPEQLKSFFGREHEIKDKESFSNKLKEAWKIRRQRSDGIATLAMLDRTGKKHSQETKDLHSKQRKGKQKSQAMKDKLRKWHLGCKWDAINRTWIKE